ncbi:substrate-binding domain-containing protein [Streptomyces sp. NPDC002209]|uniref:substrate-binding domain-containing protein n=1 Tax=Streptomyces sp. NPDC002209 TaxID=3364638 RepID=UPI0036BAE115
MARFDPRGKVNRALLVGVPAYDFKQPEHPFGVSGDLGAVEHNLAGLERALREGGVFADDGITVTRPHTVDEFDQQLDTAVEAAEGLLLLYFSGHGAVPSTGDELWLLMRRATIVPGDESVFRGAVPWKSVLTVLSRARAQQVVVILDCCYAGNASAAWNALGTAQRQRTSLLMSVQANNRIDAGDGGSPTPYTAQLVRFLHEGVSAEGGKVGFAELARELWAYMSEHHTTLREPAEQWEPQSRAATSGVDVLLAAPPVRSPQAPPASEPDPARGGSGGGPSSPQSPGPGPGPAPTPAWLARLRPLTGRRLAVAIGVPAAIAGLVATGIATLGGGDGAPCKPPLELRLLTDPDLEPTVRKAAEAYLTSAQNTSEGGCRRTGITVYSAGAAAAVAAFNRQSDPWQRPVADDTNPQRDIGPQPDIWIPGSSASVERARTASSERTYVALEADPEPFAYSPVVLAVPQGPAAEPLAERVGPLAALTDALRKRQPTSEIRRTDPENTDAGLLATVGLYGAGAPDPAAAEQGVAQPGPPARTGGDLLCTLPDDDTADKRTTVLVPEFLLRTGVGCDRTTRVRRMAEYPVDVPGLTPTFVRVRWLGPERDKAARDGAAERFHAWLTGKGAAAKSGAKDSASAVRGGLAVFGNDGFRSASGPRKPLGNGSEPSADTGVVFSNFGALDDPGQLGGPVPPAAMAAALKGYREASGPGRVLFLLDSSGSMGSLWEGPGGAPGIISQSLAGLGEQDEYGVWAVATERDGSRAYSEVLPFGKYQRKEAQSAIAAKAQVKDLEAEPDKALVAALDYMRQRGTDGRGPQLIVYITDDEDNNRLAEGGRLGTLLQAVRTGRRIPVVMASLDSAGCDKGKPDAAVSEASGGRCLDTKSDLVARLRDEVARTGTGDQG